MPIEVKEKTVPQQSVMSVRKDAHYDDLQALIGNTYITVLEYLKENKAIGSEVNGPVIQINHSPANDGPTANVEIAVPVTKPLPDRDNLKHRHLDEVRVIYANVKGSYEEHVFPAWDELADWAKTHNKQVKGPFRTLFLTSPADTGDSSKWETEIQIPI